MTFKFFQDYNGMNKKAIFAISFALISHGFSLLQLFSYAGFLIIHFGLADRNTAGYYVGNLAAIFMFGRIFSSIPFGYLSDYWGRKPVFYLSLVSVGICSIGFGFSTTYTSALIFRALSGMLNGIVIVSKTVVSEICTRETEPMGMAITTLSWNVSLLIAPGLGGILYNTGIMGSEKHFPHLIPNLLTAIISFLGLIFVYFWLPETLVVSEKHNENGNKNENGNENKNENGNENGNENKNGNENGNKNENENENENKNDKNGIGNENKNGNENGNKNENENENEKLTVVVVNDNNNNNNNQNELKIYIENEKGFELTNHDLYFALFFYFINSFAGMAFDEGFNLWAIATIEKGGLGWNSTELGICSTSSAISITTLILTIYPTLSRCIEIEWTFTLLTFISSISMLTYPLIAIYNNNDPLYVWIIVVTGLSFCKAPASMAFSSVAVILNRSTSKTKRGKVNGFSMFIGSIGKCIAPLISAPLFAWSIDKVDFPFLTFLIFGSLMLFSSIFACFYYIYKFKIDLTFSTKKNYQSKYIELA